jgi:hypothetical protein
MKIKRIPNFIPKWQQEDIDVFDKSDAKTIFSYQTTGIEMISEAQM